MQRNFSWLNKGGDRTVQLKKHITGSLALQIINKSIGFVLFPIYLTYVSKEDLGVWLTILSVVSWFNLFDLGLGNGLKNKYAEAKANNQLTLVKKYVSTTYACIGIFSLLSIIAFAISFNFISWTKIFNATNLQANSVNWLVLICFTSFFLQFTLRLINTILDADQRPAYTKAITTFSNALILLGILLLTSYSKTGSIVWLGLIYSGSVLLVLIISSIYFFSTQLKSIRPSFKFVDFSFTKPLMFLGIKFFILQISIMLIYSTDRFLISHFQTPAAVTVYDAAFRYFNILFFPFRTIVSPFWPAITDAYAKKEYTWITNGIKKIVKVWGLFLIGGLILLLFSSLFYKVWLNGKIAIPFSPSAILMIEVLINAIATIFAVFVSGVGKLGIEILISFIMSIINIPLSYLLGITFNLGTEGIVIATIICSLVRFLFLFIQYRKIISGKARGLWNA